MSQFFQKNFVFIFLQQKGTEKSHKKIVVVANTVTRKLWKWLASVCSPHISGEMLIHRITNKPAMVPLSAFVYLENVMHKRKIAVWLDFQSKNECPQNRNRQ